MEGLQLRLEVFCQFFLDFELIYTNKPKCFPNYQSESCLQCPGFANWALKMPKTRIYQRTVQILLGRLDFEGEEQPCSLKWYVLPQGFHYDITSPGLEISITGTKIRMRRKQISALSGTLNKQDHCCGVYLPPSIKGEEIPFPRYSQFFIFR